jgi:hypothetical protein
VGGKNAITGVPAATLERSPQNYFSSPPQGGIDGFYRNGRVLTFRAGDEAALNQTRLEVKVFPMKRNAMDYFRFRTGQAVISGREPSALFTLVHGGERQCEPIYEDMCNIGCWDQEHEEQVALWVGA